MKLKIFLVLFILNFTAMSADVLLKGKLSNVSVKGKDGVSAKQILFNAKPGLYKKGMTLDLSFFYLDKGNGDLSISHSSNDAFDEDHKSGLRFKATDAIDFNDSGQWLQHKVLLKNIDFEQHKTAYDVKIVAKKGVATLANIQLAPVLKTPKKTPTQKKLNVLMIIVDDLNDYIGAFGDPQALTPNIDKFVTQGVRFTRAYCQYPVCGPSRASFLSGLYPESSGVIDNTAYLRDENPAAINMFEHFKKNGYWTAGAGKIFHSNFGLYEKGTSFDEYEKFSNAANPQTLLLKKRFLAEGAHGDFKDFEKKHKVKDQSERVLCYGTELKDDEHGDGRSSRRVAEWLTDNEAGDKPFFIACGLVKPHVPFYAPQKYFELYDKDKLQFTDVPEDDWANKPKIAAVSGYKRFNSKLGVNDRQVRSEYLHAYLACISFMDAQVKVVLDALDKSGQADNTVVIFMSDHGFQIGEHFMYGKVTLFEECTRVPFSIRLPGAQANGKSSESFAQLIDVYPTLVDLCKLPAPSHLQGKSLAGVLQDPKQKVRDNAYTVVTRGTKIGRSIRDDKWRYAEWGSSSEIELYNLHDDPEQYKNLAKSPEYKDVIKKMSQSIKELQALQSLPK